MTKAEEKNLSTPSFIKVKWIDGLRFVATNSAGHSVVMDAPKQSGGDGAGFSPMQLLLIALGGCTGMDIVHIMQKQRQQINGLEISVSGTRVEEPPRIYNHIHVEYRIKGTNITENAVQRAIQLSEDKYCSVGAILKAKAAVKSSHSIQ